MSTLARAEPGGLLEDAALAIADPLVRNAGTVAGNIAHADPQNDLPAALVAARGRVVVQGVDGERSVTADDLFTDPFATSLNSDELITRIEVPISGAGAYEKLKRAAVDYGVVAVAAQLDLNDDGSVHSAGVAVTGCRKVAPRSAAAEDALVGTGAEPDDIRAAAAAAGEGAEVFGDERGSERYKRAAVTTLTERALRRALRRAKGSTG